MLLRRPAKALDIAAAIALSTIGFAANALRPSNWNGRAIRISELCRSVLAQLRALVWFQMMIEKHLDKGLAPHTMANCPAKL
jgi:hypothetical protein